jgi:hypothetical protein
LWLAPVVAFVVCVYACGTGNSTGITPTTGIVVRADDLVAGYGCGTGPSQIYEYAVIISSFPEEGGVGAVFIAGGAYPCYADATFINLCASTSGSLSFNVNVYAFTEAQWNLESSKLQNPPLQDLESYCQFDGGTQASFNTDVNLENYLIQYGSLASYMEDCVGTQQENIEVEAVCPAQGLTPVTPPP